ncbi:MAG: hypothetical protein RLZZ196_1919 [Bacteroidota bacterium]|jgi:hypothetical protein
MKVICIDSSNKPSKISSDEWIQEGVTYTVVEVVNMGLQPGKLGVRLKEVNLTEKSFPYEYYDATRFIPIEGLVAHSMEKEKEVELDLV